MDDNLGNEKSECDRFGDGVICGVLTCLAGVLTIGWLLWAATWPSVPC